MAGPPPLQAQLPYFNQQAAAFSPQDLHRRSASSSSQQPPPSPIRSYPHDAGREEGGEGGLLSTPSFPSSRRLPPFDPPSRSPSPSALSPQLTFEPTEPDHYHGQTSFGYDFLPAAQPQIFSTSTSASAHPFSGAAQIAASSVYPFPHYPEQQQPYHSSSSIAQQYTVGHVPSVQLGSSSRMSGEESDERKRRGRMSAQQEEEGFRMGEMLAERRNVMEQESGYTRNDGWEGRKEDRRGGMEEVDWNGSGAEEDDDDDHDGNGLGRRDSGAGRPGEIKTRRRTSRAQFMALEAMFMKTSKPTQMDRKNLGEQLDMSPRAVQVWFQNRRAKAKKQRQKEEEAGPRAGPPPPAAPWHPPVAFAEKQHSYLGRDIHPHSATYPSPMRRASAGAGPSRLSNSDEERMNSSSSDPFSPDLSSPPFQLSANSSNPMGGWETLGSSQRVVSGGSMNPPIFAPHQLPQNVRFLNRPVEPTGRRKSASPVYDGLRSPPQSQWTSPGGGGEFPTPGGGAAGPGFGQMQSPRRGSGILGPGDARLGRRPSATNLDGGVGPDRTVKRRDSNGSLVSDPLSLGARRGSVPRNIHPPHPHQHQVASPSRQTARVVDPNTGEVPISQAFRGQHLSSSSVTRRASLPTSMNSGGPQGSRSAGVPGQRRELSPIEDLDAGMFASQPFGSMGGPGGRGQQAMFDSSFGASGPYRSPSVGGPSPQAAVEQTRPHPFYGYGPIPTVPASFSSPREPDTSPRSRGPSYHHLHQQHQPFDDVDPLSTVIQPPSAPLPLLAQYSFPPAASDGTLASVNQSNMLARRNSAQLRPHQPLFTSSPHESYAFPLSQPPVGTLPEQGFSFGTYQQETLPTGKYAESDGARGEEQQLAMGSGRHGSTGGESDGSWAGFGGGQGGVANFGADLGGLVPPGFQPESRRSSAPADLLQNFSSLQVLAASGGVLPNAFPRPSPLNPAFGNTDPRSSSPSRAPINPLYSIHEQSSQLPSRRGSSGGLAQQPMGGTQGLGFGGALGGQQQQQPGGWAGQQEMQQQQSEMNSNYSFVQPLHQPQQHQHQHSSGPHSRPGTGNNVPPPLQQQGQDLLYNFDLHQQARLNNPNLVFELDQGPEGDAQGGGGGFGFAYR